MKSLSDIIDTAAEGSTTNKSEVQFVVVKALRAISEALAAGEEVRLHNFGSFTVKSRPERPGRNPSTGQQITIAASKSVTFKPSSMLKKAL